jgi:transcriptional regulator with XRE-family HTH domain
MISTEMEIADIASPVEQRIAQRVRALRAEAGLSLEALAARSGVSRSMISLVERAEASATAVVLDKLAVGLGVTLASLFDAPPAGAVPSPVARRADQAVWADPASGYRRRSVTPAGVAAPFQIVEVAFPPGARVAYETGAREPHVHQQVWVLDGRIDVTTGADTVRLDAGDCLAMRLDAPTAFYNPGRRPARYAVVITSPPGAGSSPR